MDQPLQTDESARETLGGEERKTDPVLFGLALGPFARRQAFIVKVFFPVMLEPDWGAVLG
jgi:hypothetical protein